VHSTREPQGLATRSQCAILAYALPDIPLQTVINVRWTPAREGCKNRALRKLPASPDQARTVSGFEFGRHSNSKRPGGSAVLLEIYDLHPWEEGSCGPATADARSPARNAYNH